MIGKRQTDYLCARQALECLRLSADELFFTRLIFGQLLWVIAHSRRRRVGQSENGQKRNSDVGILLPTGEDRSSREQRSGRWAGRLRRRGSSSDVFLASGGIIERVCIASIQINQP